MRKTYRYIIKKLKNIIVSIEIIKSFLCEYYSIYKRKKIWNKVLWSKEQQELFDRFWLEQIGHKISPMWAKLYQAQNGHFCLNYFPESIYSYKIENKFNDYYYSDILQDKALLEYICADNCVSFPKTITVCSGGYYYDNQRKVISEIKSLELIYNAVKNFLKIIVKPTRDSSSGQGIIFLDNKSNIKEQINKIYCNTNGNYIVQTLINQHECLNKLNSSSINTIRIITYIADDSVQHAPLALRIGRDGNCVDNIHAGGLVIGIKDNGYLMPEAFELGYGDKIKRYTEHPDSKVIFSDIKLATIPNVISIAERLHGRFLHTGIISWDFTIGKNEEIYLIEANLRGQSVWFPQVVNSKGLFETHEKSICKKYIR